MDLTIFYMKGSGNIRIICYRILRWYIGHVYQSLIDSSVLPKTEETFEQTNLLHKHGSWRPKSIYK
jgi:hypothetical protein